MTDAMISGARILCGLRQATAFSGRWRDALSRRERDDFVQEALIQAWGFWPRLRDPSRFESLVCTLVRRVRYQALQRPCPAVSLQDSDTEELAASELDDVFDVGGTLVARGWLRDRLSGALSSVGAFNRRLILDYYEGFSCSELAVRHRLSTDAVKTRLHRTRQRVRQELLALVDASRSLPLRDVDAPGGAEEED